MSTQATVSIFMGSKSDLPVVQVAADTLAEFNISYNMYILSAHRTPEEVVKKIRESESNGVKVFIAAAGMAAHLAGAIAAQTTKPVLGIPLAGGDLDGMDALLATVQMPKGVPVATFAIGKSGAINAAIFAAQIIGSSDDEMSKKLDEYKTKMHADVLEANESIQ
jgi:5-(carboxyamino)imidazole ribonucleotide mutase|tara:strand:+ start:208 stop:702 length:495 start_codon:yes stop_codon:yes gene_type:complete